MKQGFLDLLQQAVEKIFLDKDASQTHFAATEMWQPSDGQAKNNCKLYEIWYYASQDKTSRVFYLGIINAIKNIRLRKCNAVQEKERGNKTINDGMQVGEEL